MYKRRRMNSEHSPVPEAVLDQRMNKDGELEYRVKFVGLDNRSNRWTLARLVPTTLVEAYQYSRTTGTSSAPQPTANTASQPPALTSSEGGSRVHGQLFHDDLGKVLVLEEIFEEELPGDDDSDHSPLQDAPASPGTRSVPAATAHPDKDNESVSQESNGCARQSREELRSDHPPRQSSQDRLLQLEQHDSTAKPSPTDRLPTTSTSSTSTHPFSHAGGHLGSLTSPSSYTKPSPPYAPSLPRSTSATTSPRLGHQRQLGPGRSAARVRIRYGDQEVLIRVTSGLTFVQAKKLALKDLRLYRKGASLSEFVLYDARGGLIPHSALVKEESFNDELFSLKQAPLKYKNI